MIIPTPDQPSPPPATLTQLDQWVTWKGVFDRRNPSKPKKMPFAALPDAFGKVCPAKSNEALTWASYEEATAAVPQHRHDGLGFVFAEGGDLAGIDLDGCRDPETGEIAEWAAPWIESLLPVAYIEISPSMAGLKAWVRGGVPKALSRKDLFGPHQGIEIYGELRYFTVTGLRAPSCADEPGDGQPILDELFAAYAPREEPPALPAPAPPAAGAPASPVDGWRADRARAVQVKLKAWVGDCLEWARAQMATAPAGGLHNRRLELGKFLGGVVGAAPHLLSDSEALSALYGAKLPESHHSQELRAIRDGIATGQGLPLTPGAVGGADGRDYLPTDDAPVLRDGRPHCPRCGARVMRSRYDYVDQPPGWYCPTCRYPMIWPLSAVAEPAPPAPAAKDGAPDGEESLPLLLPADQLGRIPPAEPLIADIVYRKKLHVMFGSPGSGKSFIAADIALTVGQFYPVVYVAAEAIEDYESRVEAWKRHYRTEARAVYFWRRPLTLTSDADVDQFIAAARTIGPALIVVDPLADCMAGLVESSQEGMSVAVHALNRIRRETGAGIYIVHHSGWNDDRERGSSLLRGAARIVVKIELRDDGLITMSCVKKNHGAKFETRRFRLLPIAGTDTVVPVPASQVMITGTPRLTDKLVRLMEALTTEPLRRGATHTQICNDTQFPSATVNRLLTTLVDSKLVESFLSGKTPLYRLSSQGQDALEEEQSTRPGREESRAGRVGATPAFNWSVVSSADLSDADAIPPDPSVSPPSVQLRSERTYTAIPGFDSGDGEAEPEPEPEPHYDAAGMAGRLRMRLESPNVPAAD